MTSIVRLGVVLLALTIPSSREAAMAQQESGQPVIGVQGVALDAASIDRLSREALDGSGEAARRILLHYLVAQANFKEATYWAIIAAENGDVVGEYSAGFLLKDDPDPRNQQRALFWLRRAAAHGEPLATELLKELEGKAR